MSAGSGSKLCVQGRSWVANEGVKKAAKGSIPALLGGLGIEWSTSHALVCLLSCSLFQSRVSMSEWACFRLSW